MTVAELKYGDRFRTHGRRRVLTKLYDYPQSSHLLLGGPNGCDIQHDEKGNPIHVPHVTVKNSNGRRIDMPSSTEIISVP